MFGTDVFTYRHRFYAVVLDFPIIRTLGNGGAKSLDFGSENRQKWGFRPFRPSNVLGSTHEHPHRR